MDIGNLKKDHLKKKYLCFKCGLCWCTVCCLHKANTGVTFDIIDGHVYCSSHRYDKIEVVNLPNIYKT